MKNLKLMLVGVATASLAILVGCGQPATAPEAAGSTGSTVVAGSTENAAEIKVTVTVDKADGSDPITTDVTVADGQTAYDALTASGLEVNAEDSEYGIFVTAIDGVAGDDSHGWTYTVNGKMPDVGADAYEVKGGDIVVWTYVEF